ncbi:MAG: peptidyl-prolyl cis-trans isomerase [Clostridiales Family XIII bacterium]|nr:peptidyl-prolyl cis-trans isomerase [Clostridiales Family XIII bacterium]
MSKTKRMRVMRQRILAAVIVVVCVAAALFVYQQIQAGNTGKTLAKVGGAAIRSGIADGVGTYANYALYAQYFGQGYFIEDMYDPGSGASAAAIAESEKQIADQKLLMTNSALEEICIPYEVMKKHFKDEGKDVLTADVKASIAEAVASVFSTADIKSSLNSHGVKDRHVTYYFEYQYYYSAYYEEIAESNPATEEEIQAYYDENPDEFTTDWSLDASHILIDDAEHSEEGRARAQEILDRAKAGEDFAALADEYSEDPGNTNEDGTKNGGALGAFGPGSMVTEFEEAALALQPDEISDIVETDYGYHIIKLNSRTEESVQPLDEVRETITETIDSTHTSEALEALVAAANVVYVTDVYAETGKPPIDQTELDAMRGTGDSAAAAAEDGSSAEAATEGDSAAAGDSAATEEAAAAEEGSSAEAATEGDSAAAEEAEAPADDGAAEEAPAEEGDGGEAAE